MDLRARPSSNRALGPGPGRPVNRLAYFLQIKLRWVNENFYYVVNAGSEVLDLKSRAKKTSSTIYFGKSSKFVFASYRLIVFISELYLFFTLINTSKKVERFHAWLRNSACIKVRDRQTDR